ncbi:amidohydrolase, partial [Metarhizium hybridum]
MTRRVLEQRPAQEAPPCREPADPAPFPRSFYSFSLGTTIRPRPGRRAASRHAPADDATKKLIYTIVKADLLIPGADEPVPDAALVAEAKLIVWVGKQDAIPAEYTQKCRGTYSVPYLMPGLWDCHAHLLAGGDDEASWPAYMGFFSPRELAAVVDEARRLGRSVAAHVHGKPGIVAAVEAGVRTVEHASLADDECLALIKRRGVVYVATREAIELLLELGDDLPRVHRDKLRLVAGHHMAAYRAAVAAGVTIALGTDALAALTMARELQWAVEAGLSNLEAIRAATANGPLTVEGQAPRTGQLKAGYEADFIGVTANPVADVRVLQNEENIRWVWKGGRLFKGPGVGPWGEPAWF